MQLNIIIDDELIQQAQQINPQRSERELIETALRRSWLTLQREQTQRATEPVKDKRVSCYDLAKHLIGTIQGPPDLSTNKAYSKGIIN